MNRDNKEERTGGKTPERIFVDICKQLLLQIPLRARNSSVSSGAAEAAGSVEAAAGSVVAAAEAAAAESVVAAAVAERSVVVR